MDATESKKRLWIQLAAILGGLGLLGLLVWNIGVAEVADHLRRIGWYAPLLLVPYLAVALCDAKGWACVLPLTTNTQRISLVRLSLDRLAGEAINNLTPTANLGGEPVKAYLLHARGVPTDIGLASVIAAKTTLTVSQILFILIGVPFFLYRLGWIRQIWWVLGLLVVLAYGFILLLIRWQQRGLVGMTVHTLRRLLPARSRLVQWEERARQIDAHLLGLYSGNAKGFIASTLYHFLGWIMGAAEIAFFFYLMGIEVALVDALIIETMLQPVHAAALIIPGALGVQEAGGVVLCRLLGIEESAGLTLMALKRAREAVYNLIGLAMLARVDRTLLSRRPTQSAS